MARIDETKTSDKDARRAGLNREAARHEREIARRAARDQATFEPEDDHTPPLFSMSGIRNGLVHSTISKAVMLLLIFIFAVGFLLLSNNQPGNLAGGRQNARNANAPDPVATAAGQPISRDDLNSAFKQAAMMASFQGQSANATTLLGMQQQALQQLAGRNALLKAAQDAGVSAGGDEVNARIEKLISDRIAQDSNGNPAAARRMIESQYGTEGKYRETLRTQFDRDKVAQLLVNEKYEKQWKDAHQANEADYMKSLTALNLSVITTRPKFPERTDKNQRQTYEKNLADAKARLEKIAAPLKSLTGATLQSKFAELAKTGSDDIATKAKGGAVGFKKPTDLPVGQEIKDALQAALSKATSSTGTLVGPLEDKQMGTISLFLINGQKVDLPKDYAKNKDKLLKAFQGQSAGDAWNKYAQDLAKNADVQINDPALDAFKTQSGPMLTSGPNDTRADVLKKYDDALAYAVDDEAAAIHYQKAQLYTALKQPDQSLAEMRAAVEKGQNTLPIRLELARTLTERKDTKGALEQLQTASKQLDNTPPVQSMFGGNPNDALRAQLAFEFETAGRKDLAQAERQKIKLNARK